MQKFGNSNTSTVVISCLFYQKQHLFLCNPTNRVRAACFSLHMLECSKLNHHSICTTSAVISVISTPYFSFKLCSTWTLHICWR